MSVLYEVNLEAHPDIAEEFEKWLPGHVDEVVSLPGFVVANICREERDDDRHPAWTVRYRLIDRDALDAYLDQYAEKMRDDGEQRFGDRFSATRRILTELRRLPVKS